MKYKIVAIFEPDAYVDNRDNFIGKTGTFYQIREWGDGVVGGIFKFDIPCMTNMKPEETTSGDGTVKEIILAFVKLEEVE